MPYIKAEDRVRIAEGMQPGTPGELNYVITSEILDYLWSQGESYGTYNEIIGVLECAKLEMYRRYVAAYEDEKKEENGDVF